MATAISQLFIISHNGEILVHKYLRRDLHLNAAAAFKEQLQEADAVLAPHWQHCSASFFHISRPPGLYLGSACPEPSCSPSVAAVVMIEQLSHIYQLLRDFCGRVTEASLRANMALVQEVLDECLADGHFQLSATHKLKPFIQSDPEMEQRCSAASCPASSSPGLFGLEHRCVPSEASSRPVIQPRSAQEQRKNEVFVDVIEKISVLVAPSGQVTRCEVLGDMRLKSFLVGSTALIKLGLNEALTVGGHEHRAYGRTLHLDQCTFHSAVNLAEFESSRILALYPPEGEFSLMKYSLSGVDIRLPIRVYTYTREDGAHDLELNLQLRCDTPNTCAALDVHVQLPVPKSTSAISQLLGGPGQSAHFDAVQKQVEWKVKRIPGKGEASVGLKLIGARSSSSSLGQNKHLGPIAVHFEVSGFVCSMLQVRFLRVFDREHSYVPHRWLRYITTPDSYLVQLQ
ncbi:hypothetical protein CAPTEDRAFT_147922 [Capitella teleta]|uniref:MHD domain-containing protein n=1 Tax=Capitella teleta TaxID=283909 RepID=R7TC94_CAPTE|nr:hypothetical protein CAPTEDRAFT_147922 [Capitella teleta]|eukprot:ELT91142.1 hypothetical protein CAPTEDRAFT_147922 [Capitella teleta]